MPDSNTVSEALDAATTVAQRHHHLPTVLVYAVIASIMATLLVRWHLSKRPEFAKFSLLDAIAESGVFSIERAGKSCALVVTTIGFVDLVASEKLTEWYFLAYAAAWISADVFRRRAAGDGAEGHGPG